VCSVATGDQTTGFTAALALIIAQGQRRGEVRIDLTAAQLAGYVSVLHTTAFIAANQDPVRYRAACEQLLIFLQGGLNIRR